MFDIVPDVPAGAAPAWLDHARGTLDVGDVLAVLRCYPDNYFDAAFGDPPYGITFMGHQWDKGVPSAAVWAEVLRVLKPGAPMLMFGGSRTYHRLATAIEDARLAVGRRDLAFELRDCLMWIYGSGFPKNHDIGAAIAGQAAGWEGYGTALKPAYEPIALAVKPNDGTFAANALAHGVAGLNLGATRIPAPDAAAYAHNCSGDRGHGDTRGVGPDFTMGGGSAHEQGRWPANLLLDEDASAALDAQSGTLRTGSKKAGGLRSLGYRGASKPNVDKGQQASAGGASRFFYVAKPGRAERDAGLDALADRLKQRLNAGGLDRDPRWAPVAVKNHHPTVKPITLTQQLATLLLPPPRPDGRPRRILVPFAGSGSEMIGAALAGWEDVTGIEIDPDFAAIAVARLAYHVHASAPG